MNRIITISLYIVWIVSSSINVYSQSETSKFFEEHSFEIDSVKYILENDTIFLSINNMEFVNPEIEIKTFLNSFKILEGYKTSFYLTNSTSLKPSDITNILNEIKSDYTPTIWLHLQITEKEYNKLYISTHSGDFKKPFGEQWQHYKERYPKIKSYNKSTTELLRVMMSNMFM